VEGKYTGTEIIERARRTSLIFSLVNLLLGTILVLTDPLYMVGYINRVFVGIMDIIWVGYVEYKYIKAYRVLNNVEGLGYRSLRYYVRLMLRTAYLIPYVMFILVILIFTLYTFIHILGVSKTLSYILVIPMIGAGVIGGFKIHRYIESLVNTLGGSD